MPVAVSSTLFAEHTSAHVFAPLHYEAGYKYPLLVWIPDNLESGSVLPEIMPLVSLRNYVAVQPSFQSAIDATAQELTPFEFQSEVLPLDEAAGSVDRAIRYAFEQFNVCREKVFLIGQGRGGSVAIRLAWQSPERFAGVVSINGHIPVNGPGLAGLSKYHRNLPLLLQHDASSTHYSHQSFCEDMRLCHLAGIPATFHHFPECKNRIQHKLAKCNRWLMDHIAVNLIQ